jgi:hypothetical protein
MVSISCSVERGLAGFQAGSTARPARRAPDGTIRGIPGQWGRACFAWSLKGWLKGTLHMSDENTDI